MSETSFCVAAGYQINVLFLKNFLAPIYEVHEVRQVGEQEILVKWSWTMNFWWNRFNPFRFVWDPRLAFSGLTVLGYNPDTGTDPHCLLSNPKSRTWWVCYSV